MKRFQSRNTRNSQSVWEIDNYVSDYTDVHSVFRKAQL